VQGVYPEPEILQAKIDMLQQTNMVDFAMDIHASLHGSDAPCQGACRARGAHARALGAHADAAGLAAPLLPGAQSWLSAARWLSAS
jgi:translation initiation factor 3 subunit E